MIAGIKKAALCSGLLLALGLGSTHMGCAGSGEPAPLLGGRRDAEVPASIAQQLRACAAQHVAHLGPAERLVSFDVRLAMDGAVDSVAVKDSTLDDQDLEACMVSALRSLSLDDLPVRSESRPGDAVPSESRALLGQEEVLLGCLSSPPCLLSVGLMIGAAYIVVTVFVHAVSQSSTAKPKPRTVPTATAVPTATTMPTATTADDDDDPCMALQIECLENKKQPAWNVKRFGPEKDCKACYRECKFHAKPKGTWPDYKCPRN